MGKLVLGVVLLAVIALFFALDLDRHLTLEALRSSQGRIAEFRAESPLLAMAAYFALYVAVTSLPLPGAGILTLAGGAVFGLVVGTLLVSFASSISATLAMLSSRYLLRDFVQQRFGSKLRAINEGIARDGALYLFTLRLVPLFPFFVINLLMGLTPIRTVPYYLVSQVGMLAGTIVYVNAGTQLAGIRSVADIASPELLLAFALLGVFPLVAKAVSSWLSRRRVYARWKRPARYDRNLIVVGAGAAGLVTSLIGSTVRAKVTLIEAHAMGGDCLNFGCVPSKALIRSAKLAHQMDHAERYGLAPSAARLDFRATFRRVHEIIAAIEPHDSVERYTKMGVEVLQGFATLVDPWTVEVALADGTARRLSARHIVLATGSRPRVPPIPGLEECGYVTSETLWSEFAKLDAAPPRLVVLGGGPIGCELAQSFARLGSQVVQVELEARLLGREDEEVSALVQRVLEADGVEVLTRHKALRCEQQGGRKTLVLEHAGQERRVEFDALICAVGRSARLEGYGLEALGVAVRDTISANEYLETSYPNILVAGDVAGPYQQTHVAAHQAWYAAVNALFGTFRKYKVDYSVIPWTTFVDPEVARVGLNEQEARARGIPYEVARFAMHELDRAITDGATEGFVKVLTPPGKDRILGATIVGEHAGDVLAEYVLAMKHGLGLGRILGTIHTYPTLAEANKYAAGEWRRAHAPQKVLAWLERYHAWRRG